MRYGAEVAEEVSGEPEFARLTLDGARFEGARLPIDALVELERFRDIILSRARISWSADHPGEEVPADFDEALALTIVRVEPGSATSVLERPETDYDSYFTAAKDDFEAAFQALIATSWTDPQTPSQIAEEDEGEGEDEDSSPGPQEVAVVQDQLVARDAARASLVPFVGIQAFRDFGASLGVGESLRVADNDEIAIEVTPEIRVLRVRPALDFFGENLPPAVPSGPDRTHTVGVTAGRLVGLNADRKNFELISLIDGRRIKGRYKKDDLTEGLRDVLNARSAAPVIRVEGRLSFLGDALEKVLEARSVELFEVEGQPWSRRLIELATMGDDWHPDGEGEVISFTALEAARELLRSLEKKVNVPTVGIYPMQNGGVHLEWSSPERVTSFEISPDGEYEFFDLQVNARSVQEENTVGADRAKELLGGVFND